LNIFRKLFSHAFKLRKNPEFLSIAAMVLRVGSSVILLPVILRVVPSEQMGLWYILVAIGNFAFLVDFGIAPTVTRHVATLAKGETRLHAVGMGAASAGASIETDLPSFLPAVRSLYYGVAGSSVVLALLIGKMTYFTGTNLSAHTPETTIAFFVFVFTTALAVYARWMTSVVTGLGEIAYVAYASCFGMIGYLLATAAALLMGGGLLALALGNALPPIITNILLRRKLSHLVNAHRPRVSSLGLMRVLWPNAWRSGLIAAGSYFINYGNTLLAARYLSLSETARYGLSLQIILLLAAISTIFINNRVPQFVGLRVKGEINGLTRLFGRQLVLGDLCFLAGSLVILFVGPKVLALLGTKTDLLPFGLLAVVLAYRFLEFHHSAFATLVISANRVPFVSAALLSGVAVLGLGCWWGQVFGLPGLLAATAITQLAWNNWWTVALGCKSIGRSLASIYTEGSKSLWAQFENQKS
jgi:hypothetical protein